jgi:DNA-binding NtrC family response regulator
MAPNEEFKIFVVEDDVFYANLLKYHLSLNPDNVVELYHSGKELLQNLYKKPNLITLDYNLPDVNGGDILKKIKAQQPDLPVIMISGQDEIEIAVSLLKEGAFDYIVKNDDMKHRLWAVVKNVKDNISLKQEISELREKIAQKYDFNEAIKGNSPAIKKVFEMMEKAIKANITVSITGETGTGKDLVAKAIHYNSVRKKMPFVAVNVAAIPKELIESELFGHEKGAFTGAVSKRIGKFEQANQGTIFLDEIGEMDLNMQAKLLRVLQEREVVKVGGNITTKVDVRVIVATHKDLAEEVRKKNFREDLYYRLLGLPIKMPPLRQRGNDILILAKFFADEFSKENRLGKFNITPDAQKKLLSYHFPGNVRELKASIELACVLCQNQNITKNDLNFHAPNALTDFMLEECTLHEYTRKIIQFFMDKYDNNVLQVAEKLQIGKSTLYRMIKNGEI